MFSDNSRRSDRREIAGFEQFMQSRLNDVDPQIFLCGGALNPNLSLEEQAQKDVRADMVVRLKRDIPKCGTLLGEDVGLIEAFQRSPASLTRLRKEEEPDLGHFEAFLAKYVDLIIIFPYTPGSYAELGMFSMQELCHKILVVNDKKYENSPSFINRGAIEQARRGRAIIKYVDYENRDEVYETIMDEVRNLQRRLAVRPQRG
jgi:hypothetical protein